jgi:hypothetical protein
MARKRERKPGPAGNLDYVPHGSDQHAGLLGLKKAGQDDEPQLDGWALEDMTMWGPNATDKFLMQMLKQKVNELKSKAPKIQSENPMAPHYAPPIWKPT